MEVAILGAGAWGTALSQVLAASCSRVWLHSWRAEHATLLEKTRVNSRFLPEVRLAPVVSATSDYRVALGRASWVFLAVPTQALRATLEQARSQLPLDVRLVSACKGIETDSLMLVHEVIEDVLGPAIRDQTVHLSGPSFASEVAANVPTNLVAASSNLALAEAAQALVAGGWLRVYTSDDPIGVEVGGALKNVMAIAAGACAGLGFGYNAQAALVTRGLAEMTRLSRALGGKAQTLAGLSGLGDLILSCFGDLSRNRALGLHVGQGATLAQALGSLGGVAEGYSTARAAYQVGQTHRVDLPICEEVYHVLYAQKSVKQAVSDLLARPLKKEWS